MCGCGGGSGAWTTSSAQSGNWGNGGTWSDGPWVVQLPIYEQAGTGYKVNGFETIEVSTYSEADAKVRERCPRSGRIRGGAIRRKAAA